MVMYDKPRQFSPGGGLTYEEGRDARRLAYIRGVNFGFWSHLGCSGQNVITCSREGLL